MQKAPVFRPGPSSVDLIGRYSQPRGLEKTLEQLESLVEAARNGRARAGQNDSLPYRLKQRLGEAVVTEIVEAYERGVGAESLARQHKISKSALLELLRDQGVSIRPWLATSGDQNEEIVRLYESGQSIYGIARTTGIAKTTVNRVLKRAGVVMRPSKRPSATTS